MKRKKIYLEENQMPKQWYNIVADMPNKPLPPLDPKTLQPIDPKSLEAIFPDEIVKQEISQDAFIDIPEEVLEKYKIYRPSPLIRATELEKALDTPAKIYYKYEGVSPGGSHKTNTALAQAYYNSKQGIQKITTETGAGQWGTALSYACAQFGLECEIYMVKLSFEQKPYRKSMMSTYGAKVFASPSLRTKSGKNILEKNPNTTGSLGIAISEAIEMALTQEKTKYSLGSVLNHVLLHQTIIGEEALKQFEIVDDYPDIIIAPLGGGSNFAGLAFPFLRNKLRNQKEVRAIAVEPSSCPKLTRGEFLYDFGDNQGFTPLLPMFTLGHDFVPEAIHAGGLRYHGASVLISQLLKDGLIEAQALQQLECFEAGMLFAKTEGIIPAPEATHGIAQTIKEANICKQNGESKTILFNLSGHGLVDMQAYEDFISGKLQNHEIPTQTIDESIKKLKKYQPKLTL